MFRAPSSTSSPQPPQAFYQVLCDFEALGTRVQMGGGVGWGR